MESEVAEAVIAGKLKYRIDKLSQESAGLGADPFVMDWRFNTCEHGDVYDKDIVDDDVDDDDTESDDADNQNTDNENW
jgi:hypothetical protein